MVRSFVSRSVFFICCVSSTLAFFSTNDRRLRIGKEIVVISSSRKSAFRVDRVCWCTGGTDILLHSTTGNRADGWANMVPTTTEREITIACIKLLIVCVCVYVPLGRTLSIPCSFLHLVTRLTYFIHVIALLRRRSRLRFSSICTTSPAVRRRGVGCGRSCTRRDRVARSCARLWVRDDGPPPLPPWRYLLPFCSIISNTARDTRERKNSVSSSFFVPPSTSSATRTREFSSCTNNSSIGASRAP